MAGLFPKFITDITNKIPLFGGAGPSDSENSTTISAVNNSPPKSIEATPKNLNELVDKVMDNTNIDNRTKREILTLILNTLQHQPSNGSSASNMASNTGTTHQNLTTPAISATQPNLITHMPVHHTPTYYPQPAFYPQPPQPIYYTPHQISAPMNNMYYPGMGPQFMAVPQNMLMPQNMYYPGVIQAPTVQPFGQQSNGGQIDTLTAKVNELSGEMAELIKMMKGELIPSTNNRSANMAHIRAMIDKLSATNSSNPSEPSLNSDSSDVQTLSDLPSKSTGPDSIVDTVGSAINSINTALGLESEDAKSGTSGDIEGAKSGIAEDKSTVPSTTSSSLETKPNELSANNQKLLADEVAAKAANNADKTALSPEYTNDKADNMIDLDQYKPQEKLDNSIDEKLIDEALASSKSTNTTTPAVAANKPANTTTPAVAANKPTNTTTPAVAANKPTNTTTPAVAANKPTNTTTPAVAANKPANNLAAAIGNLSKAVPEQSDKTSVEQQGLVGGGSNGSKTLKKKSTGMLYSMANALGLTNTTQKKPKQTLGGKRGRPKKNKE